MKSKGIQAFLDDNQDAIEEALSGGGKVVHVSKSPSQYEVDALLANHQDAIEKAIYLEKDRKQNQEVKLFIDKFYEEVRMQNDVQDSVEAAGENVVAEESKEEG